MIRSIGTCLTLCVLLASCNENGKPDKKVDPRPYKESLMEANKHLTRTERTDIIRYIDRHGWEMDTTGSGLRYMIYEQGSGPKVLSGQVVRFNYQVSLLTGKVCYTSEERGAKEFLVGKGGVERGLEEAVLLLRVGDSARIILPSHLAFGLLGDDDCIPKKAVVVYDIEILKVKQPFTN